MATKKLDPVEATGLDVPFIEVYGAREHNLKNISLTIPRNQLVVFTASAAAANRRWPSIPFTPKGSAAIWKLFRPMPARFWAVWTGQRR
jgi:hypothetical protein